MQRPIVGFRQDEEQHWVALLGCGHPQHVRHNPPMVSRPWVLTPQGRQEKLGLMLNCLRCDRLELPDHFQAYRQTPVFTQDTIPAGLLREHDTRPGVWGKIQVLEGCLRYRISSLGVDEVLTPQNPGIVAPEVPHSVAPLGKLRFFVEFYRDPDAAQ